MNALIAVLVVLMSLSVAVVLGTPLPNPGFEAGEEGWSLGDSESRVVAGAACSGTLGLRVGKEGYFPSGASVHSSRFAVEPGQKVSVTFKARSRAANCGVYFWFSDANGKPVGSPPMCAVKDSQGEWQDYSREVVVPERAATVGLWIHTYAGASGLVDFDDFAVGGLAAAAVAIPVGPSRRRGAPAPVDPSSVPQRTVPPVVILKFDDVKQVKGGTVHARWKRLADYLESKRIKGGFGVVCQTLEEATPEYVRWFAERRKAGFVEFWYHGYDHATHTVDGVVWNEFNKRSYEEQRDRTARSQELARTKLGFAFTAFGPTGGVGSGSFDANTLRVMAEDPDLRVMMYPQPFDDLGRKVDAEGRLTILDRVWAVNLESAVGVPDFQSFLRGYAANLEREYFVLQGHPAAWDDARFAEFGRIIDFLVARRAEFLGPTEFADRKHNVTEP